MKIKKPFLLFLIVISVLIFSVIGFIQSARFARIVKSFVAKNVPSDWGIQGDFSDFRVNFFPPGMSIRTPRVVLLKGNVVGLPQGSRVQAERIDFKFYPLQMLSGNIRVHEASIINGEVDLSIDPKNLQTKKKKKKNFIDFSWDDLVQIQAEAVSFINTRVNLKWLRPKIETSFLAESLRVRQWTGKSGAGLELLVKVQDMKAAYPQHWKIPNQIDRLQALVHVNVSGVWVERISVLAPGVRAVMRGNVKGNLLDPKSLIANGNLDFEGNVEEILRLASLKEEASGQFVFRGKVQADLSRFLQTVAAEGDITAKDIQFRDWKTDKLEITGKWLNSRRAAYQEDLSKGQAVRAVAADGPGELWVKSAKIHSKKVSRTGGHQPGGGGTIQIGSFRIPFSSKSPISIPLELQDVHLHWLAAPGLADVYPLDFRTSGTVNAELQLPVKDQSWSLKSKLDLRIPQFQLDNQRLGKERPLSRVLKVSSIHLKGGVKVDTSGIKPEGLVLDLGNSDDGTLMNVGGKIGFKTGYDLKIDGNVDLKEFGELAEVPIEGKGRLTTHVRGPSSNVLIDFDTDLSDVNYLKLSLGKMRGRVVWEDDPQFVHFKKVKLEKEKTNILASGRLEVGKKERAFLDFKVKQGDIQDLIHIFDYQVNPFWWFPQSLTGNLTSDIQVRGGLNLEQLEVSSNISGTNWDFYGEKFKEVEGRIGYDRGKYYLERVRAKKYIGELQGDISVDSRENVVWNLRTIYMGLSDFDHIASLDVPIRGRISLKSSGEGRLGRVLSDTSFLLDQLVIHGVPFPPSEGEVRTKDGELTLEGKANGGQGILEARYGFDLGKESYIRGDVNKLDFTPMLLLLNPRLVKDRNLSGYVSGNIDLAFRSGKIELADGMVALNEYQLSKTGLEFSLNNKVEVPVKNGDFKIEGLSIRGQGGEVKFSAQSQKTILNGAVIGELDLGILEFFTPEIGTSSGAAKLDFTVGGQLKNPIFMGQASMSGANIQATSLESPFEGLEGEFLLRQNLITIRSLSAKFSSGIVSANGTVELFSDRFPRLDLGVNLDENRIKVYPFQFVKTRGKIHIHGDKRPYLVDGEVYVDSALSREKILQDRTGLRRTSRYAPPPQRIRGGNIPTFKLDIRAIAEKGILIKNDVFDAELKADVRLVNTVAVPRVLGTVEMISGKINFKDHDMRIASAKAVFDNPAVIDPSFDLLAKTEIKDKKISLYASGKMSKWNIELSSNPNLPREEIISLLTLGFTSSDFQKLSSTDQTAIQQGGAASLLLHSFDFNRDVREKTGFEIQLEEAVDTQVGTSLFRPQSDSDTSAAPKIVIKRKITKNVDVSVGSTVGVGTNSQREVNAEVRMTPGMSVIGVWNNFEDVNAKDTQTSYGVDLKFQKRFK